MAQKEIDAFDKERAADPTWDWRGGMNRADFNEWDKEMTEWYEKEAKQGEKDIIGTRPIGIRENPSYNSFHKNFTPNLWKEVAKNLKRK
tara:strand:- start:39 stop:305 length:267 start_codon:yes stop_codon:yes gene_type:complete